MIKAIVLLSGVLGYLICLGTFLYAIGFVVNIVNAEIGRRGTLVAMVY